MIYCDAFEWRFEFPEVLNDNGDFEGFDVVVGNPPYMRVQEIEKSQPLQKKVYEHKYRVAKGSYDLANLFFELAIDISHIKARNSFIFPHKFLNADSGIEFRNYLIDGKYIDKLAHFGANMIFESADTYTCIAFFSKEENKGFLFQRFQFKSHYQSLIFDENKFNLISYQSINKASTLYGNNSWILFDTENGFNVFEKNYQQNSSIALKFEGIYQGLATSKDDLYVLDVLNEDNQFYCARVPIDDYEIKVEKEFFKPFLMGKGVQRYGELKPNEIVFFPYNIESNSTIVELDEMLRRE